MFHPPHLLSRLVVLFFCTCISLHSGLDAVKAEVLRVRKNLINNSSFENLNDNQPGSWYWSGGQANAILTVDEQVAHSGKRSVRIQNPTPQAPNVYGHLESKVRLVPGTTYTLSCWYRSEDPGQAWIGGGHGWRIRSSLQPTGTQWRRLSVTFETKPEERDFSVMINTDSTTTGIWVDDIQLEEGDQATDYEAEPTVEPGQTLLQLQKAEPRLNLLPNGSFETFREPISDPKLPQHWLWHRANAEAEMTIDTSESHTGKQSLRITNETARKAHVFGLLRLENDLKVQPDTVYTISCHVKGDNLKGAWFGGGKDWLIRCQFPNTTQGHWQRITKTFRTEKDTNQIPVLIVTEDVTEPFWVDDIQLVEGNTAAPTIDPLKKEQPALHVELPSSLAVQHNDTLISTTWNPTRFPRDRFHFIHDTLLAEGWLILPQTLKNSILSAQLKSGETVLVEKTLRGDLTSGNYLLTFGTHLDENIKDVELVIQLHNASRPDAPPLAQSSLTRHLITTGDIKTEIEKAAKLRDQLAEHVEKLREEKRDPAYPLVTRTTLDRFLLYAEEDLQKGQLARAYDAALEMQTAAKKSLRREFLPPVPRYQSASKGLGYRLDGPAQLGTALFPDGHVEKDRPIQFLGVGHFGQVVHDLELLNDFGMNIIQIELGPRSVLRVEDEIDTSDIDRYLGYLDKAQASNVAVCLLLSPHYFPDWAMEKYPHLADAGGGFLKYDVHAPESREIIEKFLRTIIPRIKDHPALHSICLSNEPVFCETEKSTFVKERWHLWLQKKHETLGRLNQTWGSTYDSFDAVPVPKTEFQPTPICYDFVQFNQETFAEWHQWMANIVHEIAPELPVHAKIMMMLHFARNVHGQWSIAPELFGQLSDFHGNDHFKPYDKPNGWANDWVNENAGYDYQRSNGDKPIFNTENHLIRDRNFDYIPPEHIYNVFWQGAIHGQSATTTWVWERTDSVVADAAGSILHRPGCTDAMGQAGLDLMRLAPEVTALQKELPQIALLWSDATMIARHDCMTPLQNAYEALNFQGVPLGFVNDRQLAAYATSGKLPERLKNVKLIVAPGTSHAPETTLQGLKQFQENGGKVLCLGDGFLANEYGKPFEKTYDFGPTRPEPDNAKQLFDDLPSILSDVPLQRGIRVVDAAGQPVWGVEYLATEQNGKTVVNLCNYRQEPQPVRLFRVDGRPALGRDLLTNRPIQGTTKLLPLVPQLIELE